MAKSLCGLLDLKTGLKVVFWSNLIEYTVLYIISLVVMISSKQSTNESLSKFQPNNFYQDEIANHVRLSE